MVTLNPILTSTPGTPTTYNTGMAETFSWIPVENDADRPMFAKIVYPVEISNKLTTIIDLLSTLVNK